MKKILFIITLLIFFTFIIPTSTKASTNACQASSVLSLKDCITKLNSGQVNTVEITTQIICSGDRACDFPAIITNQPISIYGTPNSNAGIKRIDHYNYAIFKFNPPTPQTTVSNLIFDDTNSVSCSASDCLGVPIYINGGINFIFDGITIQNTLYIGLVIENTQSVTIRNSRFINNGWFAIWTSVGQNLHIEGNTFQNITSNAILATFAGSDTNPSTIRNNYFINNHKQAIFSVCDPGGTSLCPGGQIFVHADSNNLIISNNTIIDGSLNIGTTGIELNGNTSNLTIQNNDIHHNTGAGIYLNGGTGNVSNLTIINNMIYNNIWMNIYAPGANISGNCETAGCNPATGVILTPTPTLTPTPIPGDINGDGHVDLSDFNIIVSHFGNPYTIYDYNNVITNFKP